LHAFSAGTGDRIDRAETAKIFVCKGCCNRFKRQDCIPSMVSLWMLEDPRVRFANIENTE